MLLNLSDYLRAAALCQLESITIDLADTVISADISEAVTDDLLIDLVYLTLYRPMFPSYRNQSVDLRCKSTDWFLYDGNIGR